MPKVHPFQPVLAETRWFALNSHVWSQYTRRAERMDLEEGMRSAHRAGLAKRCDPPAHKTSCKRQPVSVLRPLPAHVALSEQPKERPLAELQLPPFRAIDSLGAQSRQTVHGSALEAKCAHTSWLRTSCQEHRRRAGAQADCVTAARRSAAAHSAAGLVGRTKTRCCQAGSMTSLSAALTS